MEGKEKFSTCEGRVRINNDGGFEFKPDSVGKCKKVLDKLNPIKGNYWKRHIEELREEVKHSDV